MEGAINNSFLLAIFEFARWCYDVFMCILNRMRYKNKKGDNRKKRKFFINEIELCWYWLEVEVMWWCHCTHKVVSYGVNYESSSIFRCNFYR